MLPAGRHELVCPVLSDFGISVMWRCLGSDSYYMRIIDIMNCYLYRLNCGTRHEPLLELVIQGSCGMGIKNMDDSCDCCIVGVKLTLI